MGYFKARTLAGEGYFISFKPPINNLSIISVLGSVGTNYEISRE